RTESGPEGRAGQADGRVVGGVDRQFVEFSIDQLDVMVLEETQVSQTVVLLSGPTPPAWALGAGSATRGRSRIVNRGHGISPLGDRSAMLAARAFDCLAGLDSGVSPRRPFGEQVLEPGDLGVHVLA